MAQRSAPGLLVLVHGTETPTEAEWDRFLSELGKGGPLERVRVLVFTESAAPNTVQRERLNKRLAGAQPPMAVLSDSKLVRGVGTALGWFNARFRVFATSELEAAMAHLGLTHAERETARALAEQARAELAAALGPNARRAGE